MTRLLSECDLYNEVDPSAVTWLGQLIADGHLPDGRIESDSIEDVLPTELARYRHAHFFAGIGGWPLALKLAGWPSGIHTWTGSCPCQPFSAAGKGAGFTDPRHLWPAWYWHICQCLPDVIFGEQVASPDGYAWLDVVQDGLEDAGYAVGATVTPAAGYGAPHARHRIYFAAVKLGDDQRPRLEGHAGHGDGATGRAFEDRPASEAGASCELANHDGGGWQSRKQTAAPARYGRSAVADGGFAGPMPGPVNGFWKSADWLRCRGDKWRPVEPGTFPLVDRIPGRVGLLRGYGNAIVIPQAVAFVEAVMEVLGITGGRKAA